MSGGSGCRGTAAFRGWRGPGGGGRAGARALGAQHATPRHCGGADGRYPNRPSERRFVRRNLHVYAGAIATIIRRPEKKNPQISRAIAGQECTILINLVYIYTKQVLNQK